MTKVKTSKLTGIALDWAVAKAEGMEIDGPTVITGKCYWDDYGLQWFVQWEPTTNWAQGGPIIERENITVRPVFHAERTESGTDIYRQDGWAAHIEPKAFWVTPRPFTGPTPLIAAMRCYVASRLGDEVDMPEELS